MAVEPLDLDAIEARANAATGGPWNAWHDERTAYALAMRGSTVGITDGGMEIADALFIAAAREDVPALVAEVRRLRARVDELEERLRDESGDTRKYVRSE